MAANLIKAGHEVTVYNRSRGKVDALAAEGALPAASVARPLTPSAPLVPNCRKGSPPGPHWVSVVAVPEAVS